MKKIKRILKRCMAVLCIGMIAISLNSSELMASGSFSTEARYSGGSSILEIMSKYIYFVEGNLSGTTTAHTSGSIVVGGDLNYASSGFGNIMVAPSYIGHICGLNYINSMFPGTEGYQGNRIVYYGTVEPGVPGYLFYNPEGGNSNESLLFQNSEYMSVATIMNAVRQEAAGLAAKGNTQAYTIENKVLTIDFSKAQHITISEDVSQIQRMELKNVTIEELMKQSHIISFVSTGTVNLNAQNIYVDGNTIDQKFMNYAINNDSGSASTGGQYYLGGLNLIWNIPNAKNVNCINLNGQLVAPNANVTLTGGRHEGCVIALSVYTDSEAHFYPLGILISKNEDCTTEVTTTEATTTEATTTEATTTEVTTTEATTTETTTTEATTTEATTTEVTTTEATTTEATTTEATTAEATTTEAASTSNRAVQTGDEEPLIWIVSMAVLSLGGGVLLIRRRK